MLCNQPLCNRSSLIQETNTIFINILKCPSMNCTHPESGMHMPKLTPCYYQEGRDWEIYWQETERPGQETTGARMQARFPYKSVPQRVMTGKLSFGDRYASNEPWGSPEHGLKTTELTFTSCNKNHVDRKRGCPGWNKQ